MPSGREKAAGKQGSSVLGLSMEEVSRLLNIFYLPWLSCNMWGYLLSKEHVRAYEKHDRSSIIFEMELLNFAAGTALALSHARHAYVLQAVIDSFRI